MFADKNNDAHNLLKYATLVTKIPPITPLGRLACAIFGTDVRPIPITHNSSFPSLTVSRAGQQVPQVPNMIEENFDIYQTAGS